MASQTLFQTFIGPLLPRAAGRNQEGAPAFERSPEQALAQFAATGCLNSTFYASDEAQLTAALELAGKVPTEFVAKTAVYSRERGQMKDMPALLLAVLSRRDARLMERVFDRVINSPRMLRTFVQIVRSGTTGRRSFGTVPRRCVRRWLDRQTDAALFAASVGEAPSLTDIIRMVHPKPATPERAALYAYLVGRQTPVELLPAVVKEFETFKADTAGPVPDVPFQMLTGMRLDGRAWREIARRASWQTTRMNLNTFARQGVFEDPEMVELVAARLRDPEAIRKARAFPYQLLTAARFAGQTAAASISAALEEAMEIAVGNVPVFNGQVFVCPDVSESMKWPLTGIRAGATTRMRCVDVAALITASVLRRNPTAQAVPFHTEVVDVDLPRGASVVENANTLASLPSGGTSISAPLARLNQRNAMGELVIIVSDNESWADAAAGPGTATMREWSRFRARNPQARLVLLDLQPNRTTQVIDRRDVLNVGGFSDAVYDVIAGFNESGGDAEYWVREIEKVKTD